MSPVCDRHSVLQSLRPALWGDHPAITWDAGDSCPLQIYAAGCDAGHCTEPFVHGQFCLRVFCQKCRNIIVYANFQGINPPPSVNEDEETGPLFFPRTREYTHGSSGRDVENGVFFFFFSAGAWDMCFGRQMNLFRRG